MDGFEIVKSLELQPHPEGGFYKETYRSEESIAGNALPERFSGDRSVCTGIYYLLPEGEKSHLHRIKSDEMWHFYLGGAMTIYGIRPDGRSYEVVLGSDIENGEKLQFVVPAGDWFAAAPNEGVGFSLVGCTVAPGFDFADFEMADRQQLSEEFPISKDLIDRFTT